MAKNWLDPVELQRESRIYGAFVLVLCGISAWDVLSTLHFDISIVRGKRPFKWPMILYFIVRICLLLHIFAYAVNLNAISEIPCQQVVWISKATDAIGTCVSSLILILRTRAVWHRDLKVTGGLGLLFCGQIALWCQTFRYSRSQWNAQRGVCAVIATAPKPLLVAVFAYTMVVDFIILVLCAYRLYTSRRQSSLAKLLLRDGIGYFCAAFGANLLQTIFAALGLNPIMNIIALPFALVVSAIAATTVFRNVFTAYDAFSSETSGNTSSGGQSSLPFSRMGLSNAGNTRATSSKRMTRDIPLGDFKNAHEVGGISVHRVVELDRDDIPKVNALGVNSMLDRHSLEEKGSAI